MKRLTLEEILEPSTQISLLNEPIDYSVLEAVVDYSVEVQETAEQRARRRWRMEKPAE
jgi:hypothetical protein